ncbi:MAG TPA: PAS domain S-box protein, partial [Oculatellaceae cyanobacterium]
MTKKSNSKVLQQPSIDSLEREYSSSSLFQRLTRQLSSLSIGSKISCGYGLALCVACLGAVTGFMIGGYYQQQATALKKHAEKELNLLVRLQTSVFKARSHQQQFIPLTQEPELLQKEYSRFLAHAAAIKQALSELKYYTKSKEYRDEQHVDDIPRFIQTYQDIPEVYFRQLQNLLAQIDPPHLKSGKIEASQKLLINFTNGSLAIKFDDLADNLTEVINISVQERERAEVALMAAQNIRLKIVAISILSSIVTASFVAAYISRAIARPLKVLTDVAQRVTTEANLDLQAPVLTEDEVGVLATSLNQLILKVKHLLAEQKAIAEALQEREENYSSVVDNVKEVIFQTNADGLWTFLNPAWTEITGFPLGESINTNFINYVYPDDRQRNLEQFQLLLERQNEYCRYAVRYITKDGGYRWVEIHARLTLAPDNTIEGTSGTLRDITNDKWAEAQLQESERKLRQVIDVVPHFIFAKDKERRFILANKALAEAFGTSVDELLYKRDEDFAQSEENIRKFREDDLRVFNSGQPQHMAEETITDAQGNVRFLQTTKLRYILAGSEEPALVGVAIDITQRKQAENALQQQFQRALLLKQITQEIRQSLDSHQIFQTTANQIGLAFRVNRCALQTYVAKPTAQIPFIAEYLEPGYSSVRHFQLYITGNPYIEQLLSQEEALASD